MTRDISRIDALVELGRFHEARPLADAALLQAPDDPRLLGLRAVIALGLEDPDGALAAALRLVAADPGEEWGHRLASLALEQLGRHGESLDAAAHAVRCDPNGWQTHVRYAHAACEVRGRMLDAQAAADRGVALAPEEPSTHFISGYVAQRRGWDDLAAQAYRRTLALDPEHAGAINNLTVLEGRGISGSARGFAHALSLDPQDRTSRENIDGLAARFVRRFYWASLPAFVIALLVAVDNDGGGPTPLTVLIAVALVGGSATSIWWLGRRIPTGVRRYAVQRLAADWFLRVMGLLSAAMFALALVACLSPAVGLRLADAGALRAIGLVNVAVVVFSVVRARH